MIARKEIQIKPFMGLKEAVDFTGLSYNFLRTGCVKGEIPHMRVGKTIYINMFRFLESLDALPSENMRHIKV